MEFKMASGKTVEVTPVGHVKHDQGKTRYTLVPPRALEVVARVLTHGAEKYSDDNWRLGAATPHRYMDAAMRHIEAVRKGEILDEHSGLPHLAHAICCLMFLTEYQLDEDKNHGGGDV